MKARQQGRGLAIVCWLISVSAVAETVPVPASSEGSQVGTVESAPAAPAAPPAAEKAEPLRGVPVDPFAEGSALQVPDAAPVPDPAPVTEAAKPEPCEGTTPEDESVPRRTTWDPRSGYGLCPEICGQSDACTDGRCVSRCSPSCRDGTYCTAAGECLPMPRPPRELETEADLQTRHGKPSKDDRYTVFIDLGGILFHGVRPSFEWGKRHAFQVRLQLLNTGLMNYSVEPHTEYENFEWGLGGSMGYRHYEARFGNLRGFFYGGGLGYSITQARDDVDQNYVVYNHALSVYGEFGYRWVFDHFLFGFGPSLGVRVPICSHYSPLDSAGSLQGGCQPTQSFRFDGTMSVEVGWFP